MSYILDALRRADSERERERGAVPGLHARPVAAEATTDGDTDRRVMLATVGAGAALVVAALLIGWLRWRPIAPVPTLVVPAAQAPNVARAPEAPAPAVVAAAAPAVVLPIPASAPLPAADAAVPARAAIPRPPLPPRRVAEAPPPAAPRPAASAEARVPTLAELPPALRTELPAITIGGAMHSPDAGSRMLIVNGQLYREGEKIGPELFLEQIKLKDAVLRYKGTRYSVSF